MTRLWFATVGLGPQMGGVGSVARSTIKALAACDSELRIVSFADHRRPSWLPDNMDFVPCANRRASFFYECARQVFFRPKHVIFDHIDMAQCQSLLPSRVRASHVLWIHGIEVWRELPRLKRNALYSAEMILANSNYTSRTVMTWHPGLSNIKVVHPAVDPVVVDTSNKKEAIITVARFSVERSKGQHEMLAVMSKVLEACPNAEWHVVGDGPGRSRFERQISRLNVRQSVHVHGFVDQKRLSELYSQSKILCMPSSGEGFGIVFVEAMRHACVCIGSTSGASSEVIADAGYVVDPSDVDAFAAMIVSILRDDARRQEIVDRGLIRAERFTPACFEQAMANALELKLMKRTCHAQNP